MRVIIPNAGRFWRFWLGAPGKIALAVLVVFGITGLAIFSHHWFKYARLIDRKLSVGPFNTPSKIFAAPQALHVGQVIRLEQIASHLRGTGYSESNANRIGWYRVRPDAIEIFGARPVVAPGQREVPGIA